MNRRWHRLPLRPRLVALGMAGLLAGFTIGGAGLVWALHYSLQSSVDAAATRTAEKVAAMLVADELPDPIPTGRDFTVVEIYDAQGRFELGSPDADPQAPLLQDSQRDAAVANGEHFTVPDHHGAAEVLRATAVAADDRVVVAAVTQPEMEAVPKLAKGLAVTLTALVAVVTAVLWIVVGRTLRPVEAARQKQRSFVADAAHELRSPLANMRTELEVAERVGAPPELLRDLLADVQRLSRMTEDLLLLSRLDESARPWRPDDVDAAQLTETTAAGYAHARVPVRVDLPEADATLRADPDAVRRILTNLIDNAVRHADAEVWVRCRVAAGQVTLTVVDDGPGIPESERERVFHRFTRLDDSRGRDSGGAGLGLPIAADLTAAHGGNVTLHTAQPRGLRITVRLPRH